MTSISACMIVKNEENVLARCLDCICDLVDEIIIVDTGSVDGTCAIAAKYTDKIYHFKWIDDFAAARNFAFSQCNCDYIYAADADEVIDSINRERFLILKEALLPEIEVVQMKYGNQLQYSTIYNYEEEYRPKLYKRVRSFVWEYPIHEAVRLTPVVYDSDVIITHMPEKSHTERDLRIFENMIQQQKVLDKRMLNLYAKELYVSGTEEDFKKATNFFEQIAENIETEKDTLMEAFCIVAKAARIEGNVTKFFKYAMKAVTIEGCSEICYELGQYYQKNEDYREAEVWYYNAAYETHSILNIQYEDALPKRDLEKCREQK